MTSSNTPERYRTWQTLRYRFFRHSFSQSLALVGLVLLDINPLHINVAKALDVSLTADRVPIGAEFLARRLDLPNKLIVSSGQTIELPADATYDYIEVAGILRVSRTHDTTTRFTHLVIL